jgi:hypothetical protein
VARALGRTGVRWRAHWGALAWERFGQGELCLDERQKVRAGMSLGEQHVRERSSRLKAGCSQDWLPHKALALAFALEAR